MHVDDKACCVVIFPIFPEEGPPVQCDKPPTHSAYSPEGMLKCYCTEHFDLLIEKLREWNRTNYSPEHITKVKKLNPGLL